MQKILIAIFTVLLSASVLAQEGFSSLEEQMTGKEYKAAGLDKLTPDELQALNDWIRAHSLGSLATTPRAGSSSGSGTATTAAATSAEQDMRGFERKKESEEKEDRSTITSRLVGTFSGWDGNTIFKLENGMIWEQDDRDKYYVSSVENPSVEIKPGLFGAWHLTVEGHGRKVRVERVQ